MQEKEQRQTGGVLPIIPLILLSLGYLAVLMLGKRLLQEEFLPVLSWWATLLVLGAVCLPLGKLLFSGFQDRGYLFSKTISLALSGWLLWAASSLHLLKFTRTGCFIAVAVVLAGNVVLAVLEKSHSKVAAWEKLCTTQPAGDGRTRVTTALLFELLFLLAFLLGCYMKCYKPEAYGTEKFMDFAFMKTMMKTDYMPPQDMWYAGADLNYYYLGQYFATFLTKLSGVDVGRGYNLSLMMLFAFCILFSYEIVFEVISLAIRTRDKRRREQGRGPAGWCCTHLVPHVAGLLSGIAVTMAGNMHYTIYAKLIPTIQNMLGMEVSGYWFPDATRYIGYHPETNDKTIHEFPAYSFVLGDLHAHVTNLMFVLTIVAILFAWLLYRNARMEATRAADAVQQETGTKKSAWLREVFHPSILAVGFFIGLFQMTNYWDFPIYFIVSGAVILFSNAVIYRFRKEAAVLTAFHALVVLSLAFFVPLLFRLNFRSMARGIAISWNHTPLYQLAVLWGLPLLVLLGYLLSEIVKQKKLPRETEGKKKMPALFCFIYRLETADLFVMTIGLCAAGLVLLPELVYVIDIYSGDYKRANTMFKLTYQAFLLFGLMMGYVITKFILLRENVRQVILGLFTGCLLLSTVGYWNKAVSSWFGNIRDRERFQSLDATAFIEKESSSDAKAIAWINESIAGTPVMLEADGDSYTLYERVSTLTGLPTVLGWHTHEWLWQDSYDAMHGRENDVTTIYTSTEETQVRELLQVYDVSYIYIGLLEQKKYGNDLNTELLLSLGTIVYEADGVTILQVNPQ